MRTEEERCEAINWFASHGVDISKDVKLAAIQLSGGWQVKGNWKHHETCVSELQNHGFTVVVITGGTKVDAPQAGVIYMETLPLRLFAAIISLLDVVVTFDSGAAWLASAFETPCVSLWGPRSPEKQMGAVETNSICLRKRTPDMCQQKRGANCRTTHGGAQCPFREGRGGDCFDEITAEEVLDEVDKFELWGVAVEDRG